MTKFFTVPFAETGDKISPPNPTQVDGTVSYAQGFGFDYQRKTDGTDPLAKVFPREQFNGIVNDITGAVGEIQLNGLSAWQDLTPKISYPVNAMVRHANKNWVSLVANNTATPAEGASWTEATVVTYSRVQIDTKLNLKADSEATENAIGKKLTAATRLLATDLNTLRSRSDIGVYFQDSTSSATLERNYPYAAAGSLLVTAGEVAVQQEYTTGSGLKFVRAQESTTLWKPWVLVNPREATESVVGVAAIATQGQVGAGTNDAAFVTPKKLNFGFDIVMGASGYIQLPNWLGNWMFQWVNTGSQNAIAGGGGQATKNGTWLKAFASGPFVPFAIATASAPADLGVLATPVQYTTTGFSILLYNTAAGPKNILSVIAVGVGR